MKKTLLTLMLGVALAASASAASGWEPTASPFSQ